NFAFTRKQRHGAHFAEVHANGIVSLFKRAGREIEFDLFAFFAQFSVEAFFALRRRELRTLKQVNALGTNRRQQIVEVFRRVQVMRDQVVDLVVGQVSLLLTGVDQLFYVVLVVNRQCRVPLTASQQRKRLSRFRLWSAGESSGLCRNLQILAWSARS